MIQKGLITYYEQIKAEDFKHLSYFDMTQFLLQNYHILNISQTPYIYIQQYGCYCRITKENYDMILRSILPIEALQILNTKTTREIYAFLKAQPSFEDDIFNHERYIIFNNGLYDIEQQCLIPHTPNLVFNYHLKIPFIPGPPLSTPYFDQFILTLTQGDTQKMQVLLELFGYVISNIRSPKLINVLYGVPNSGKSIFLYLLKQCFIDDDVSALSLIHFKNEFRPCELSSTRLNICAEIDNVDLHNIQILKQLSGGDLFSADRKNNTSIKFINQAALVFATNDIKTFVKNSDNKALIERLCILDFNYSVPQEHQIPNLRELLRYELPSIIKKYVLPSIYNFYQTKYFSNPQYIEDKRFSILFDTFGLIQFIKQNCIFEENARVSSTLLQNKYKFFCDELGIDHFGRGDFIEPFILACKEEFNSKVIHGKMRINNESINGFQGIRLIG